MKHMQRINTDNKGFSLVELIVVVLIMGILTMGLTPQVLRWVNNARKASDLDYMHNLESAVSLALMNADVYADVTKTIADDPTHNDIVLTVDSSGTDDTISGESKLLKKTAEVLGFATDAAGIEAFTANKIKVSENKIEIHINGGRAVGKYVRVIDGSTVEITDD